MAMIPAFAVDRPGAYSANLPMDGMKETRGRALFSQKE
jgi:hypothetical protein